MKKNNIFWYILIVLCFVILIVGFIMIKNSSRININQITGQSEENSEEELLRDYLYADETIYNGDPWLSSRLFRTPFKKSDNYICNKLFIERFGIENSEIMVKKASLVASKIFNIRYKDAMTIDEELLGEIAPRIEVIFKSGTETEGSEDTLQVINNWFVESQTSMESTFITDKCLVYYDENSIIVRGLLQYSVYETKDSETLIEAFGIDRLNLGEEYSALVEMKFIPDIDHTDFETFNLTSISMYK